MRAVLQRVTSASVSVREKTVASIGQGLLALVGVADGDGEEQADWLAEKTANIRIFEDEAGKMNLSVLDVRGEVLAVSQFTLLADARKGRRPSFAGAAAPEHAQSMYREYQKSLARRGCPVSEGVFQEDMAVSLVNDGPVTIILDTCEQPGQKNSTR